MNSVHITKLGHTTSSVWKKLSKKLKNTILSPHAMYFLPKKAKMARKRFFLEFSLGYFINRPKIQINKYAKLRRS